MSIVADTWQWDEERLRAFQLEHLNNQLHSILPLNAFYREKFGRESLTLADLSELSDLPFTTKQDLVRSAERSPTGVSLHHTFELGRYSRVHRTSGTTGEPLLVLDTAADWSWWSATWQHVLEAAGIVQSDRVFMAFSFGPFVGFWSAHQALVDRGATVIPGGGLTSLARLEFMKTSRANVVCCTPSYALHLAEVAQRERFPLPDLNIDKLIVAGEAGGSIPAVRSLIEDRWQARVVDHSGATEIGPWGFGWPDRIGLHIVETSFIAELLPVDSVIAPAMADPKQEMYELVLTSLGRLGSPVIRYRTGDVVAAERPGAGACRFVWLPQGVIGRVDNMVTVRGVNIFPSSIDALVRQFPAAGEYRVRVSKREHLDELAVEIEGDESTKQRIEKQLAAQLGLRIPVSNVPAGSLPRSEGKSRRWLDER